MKKTMFITSVIMVVVMAIALTTSSLAWFTATGAASVTTSALTVTAKANASTGIQITKSLASGWFGSISLVSGDTYGSNAQNAKGMMPLLPYKVNGDATLLDALTNNNFIYNDIDSNMKFVNANGTLGSTANGNVDYFAEENIFITNMAQGSGVQPVYINATVTFKGYDESAHAWVDYVYDGSHNTSDPELIVAVLAETTCYMAADGTTREANVDPAWEIINISSSRGNDNVHFGRLATDFQTGDLADASSCATYPAIADLIEAVNTKTFTGSGDVIVTSDSIDPIDIDATSGEYREYGEIKQFKVVAWYDGTTLVNSNSGTSLQFIVSFDAYNANLVSEG